MNVQEKMTMLKCYAYQKRESQGMEGKEAGMLEDWIDEEALAGEVTPEEILQWLYHLTQSSLLAEDTKERISKAYRLLIEEWKRPA